MDTFHDNPLTRCRAFCWGLAALLLFGAAAAVARFALPRPGPTLEDLAAAPRYAAAAEVRAAQQANLAWREAAPGQPAQVPPRAVFAAVGKRLLASPPAAVETPEQRVTPAEPPAEPPAAPAPSGPSGPSNPSLPPAPAAPAGAE